MTTFVRRRVVPVVPVVLWGARAAAAGSLLTAGALQSAPMTNTQRVRKAVMPVAGLGTRFLPVTKAMPKEMLPIVDVPTVQLNVEECIASGIEEIIFVTARGK